MATSNQDVIRYLQTNGGTGSSDHDFADLSTIRFYIDRNAGTGISSTQAANIRTAVQQWENVIDLNIVETTDPNQANIRFVFEDHGDDYAGAEIEDLFYAINRRVHVVINSSDEAVASNSNLSPGSIGFQVLLHEIGHALGLTHPGPYNGDVFGAAVYGEDNVYPEDNKLYTVMSYFEEGNAVVPGHRFAPNWDSFARTPQLHDLLAIQDMYGANTNNNGTDTVYGFNATSAYFRITLGVPGSMVPTYTIWDTGGIDTLDGSGIDDAPQYLDLQEGHFSSLGAPLDESGDPSGVIELNVAIAFGVTIENARGGDSDDIVIGNDARNMLEGNGGMDEIHGGGNDDNIGGGAGDDTIYGEAGNDLIFGGGDKDTIFGGTENDTIRGEEGDDTLFGQKGNDTLLGGRGIDSLDGGLDNDILEGGEGADALNGSLGFDTASYEHATGAIIVRVSATQFSTFGDIVGDTFTSIEGFTLSNFDDVFMPFNVRPDMLVLPLAGNETIHGLNGNDEIHGGEGNDKLFGDADADKLFGDNGNDELDGGTGIDDMSGGAGDDTYYVDNSADIVRESNSFTLLDPVTHVQRMISFGTDTVMALASYVLPTGVENLTLLGVLPFSGTGNILGNIITGNSSGNLLNGMGGGDRLIGKGGNDIYVVDSTLDVVDESNGFLVDKDTVQSSISFSLASTTQVIGRVENLTLTGTASLNGTGNDLVNALVGNSGNNTLQGAGGDDTLQGGRGNDRLEGGLDNDTYDLRRSVTSATGIDTILDTGGASDRILIDSFKDIVSASRSGNNIVLQLTNGTVVIENALLSGGRNVVEFVQAGVQKMTIASVLVGGNASGIITGSMAGETLDGRGGDDILFGNAGNDTLIGGTGNDRLAGGRGHDTLVGGLGQDMLTGGLGRDLFDFNDVAESGLTPATRDVLLDFTLRQDRIDLSTMDAIAGGADNAFVLLAPGTAVSAVGAGRIGWYQEDLAGTANDKTILRINNDGDADIEMTIEIKGLVNLTAADFVL